MVATTTSLPEQGAAGVSKQDSKLHGHPKAPAHSAEGIEISSYQPLPAIRRPTCQPAKPTSQTEIGTVKQTNASISGTIFVLNTYSIEGGTSSLGS